MVEAAYLLNPVAGEVEGGELGVLVQSADLLDAVVGEVELVELLEAVEALHLDDAVTLETQEAVEDDTGLITGLKTLICEGILNFFTNSESLA